MTAPRPTRTPAVVAARRSARVVADLYAEHADRLDARGLPGAARYARRLRKRWLAGTIRRG